MTHAFPYFYSHGGICSAFFTTLASFSIIIRFSFPFLFHSITFYKWKKKILCVMMWWREKLWGNIYQCDASSSISSKQQASKRGESTIERENTLCVSASHKTFTFHWLTGLWPSFHAEKSSHVERDGSIILLNSRHCRCSVIWFHCWLRFNAID